ncbi:hypothetical protein N7536_011665 [Penicillium majusculum]|uniref:Uncharacterized protein n=1 Tax=Penicillium solitum TaxID=60172 RepID=A0A1V6QVG4_9EURO|nr:uncharacterized protein PENSOL_c035G09130 [Penicillium solitum]KAJ5680526.1 hypothetical protein N7536_011665 [Penicillium majusculum]OQD93017.1 hypothetical protein PENSOL_c035G09130 [Penicillium solitum]
MHIQSLLVPAILAIGVSAGASRWCEQRSDDDNQNMKCYWESCGTNNYGVGYEASDGSKILSTTKKFPASAQCNPQSDVYHKYKNLPSDDCCDAFGNQPRYLQHAEDIGLGLEGWDYLSQ